MSVNPLQIVATPLGNAQDLSPRAAMALENADILLAEDTRRAALAFARWGIKPRGRLISLHEHNEAERVPEILGFLREGQAVALLSDAGMPVLSDPGYLLVRACHEHALPVAVLPGPCAPVTALAASGIPPQPFVFFGFPPRKQGDIRALFAPYAAIACTLVFFERKDRVQSTLAILAPLLGAREACLCRELTKIHEEILRFRLEAVPDFSALKGEICLVIGPPEGTLQTEEANVLQLLAKATGAPKARARQVQQQVLGWSTSQIYELALRHKEQP